MSPGPDTEKTSLLMHWASLLAKTPGSLVGAAWLLPCKVIEWILEVGQNTFSMLCVVVTWGQRTSNVQLQLPQPVATGAVGKTLTSMRHRERAFSSTQVRLSCNPR